MYYNHSTSNYLSKKVFQTVINPLRAIQDKTQSDIEARLNVLRQANDFRFDMVIKLADSRSVSEALKAAKVTRYQYYVLSPGERQALEQLAVELRRSNAIQAQLKLYEVAAEAVDVKVRGLRSKSERISQAAASDILDRTVGQAKQSGGNVGVVVNVNWDYDKILWGGTGKDEDDGVIVDPAPNAQRKIELVSQDEGGEDGEE